MDEKNRVGHADQPGQSGGTYAVPQDEISLRDLWEIIARRKWLVLLTTVVCVGLAVAYVGLATTVYESRGMVQIGRVAGKPLDNGLQLASRLMNEYTPVNTEVAKKQLPKLYTVTADKDDPSLLTLVVRGRSPEQAQTYLQGVIQHLLASQQKRFDQVMKTRQAQLAQLQAQYQELDAALQTKAVAKGNSDSVSSAVLLLEQSKRVDALATIMQNISRLQDELTLVNSASTEMTLPPSYDPIPVAPKRLLILVLSLVGGLMVGVFLALMANAFKRE